MAINQLFSGVQAVHANNKLHALIDEGYMSHEQYDKTTRLSSVTTARREYTGLKPGIYRVKINNLMYGFVQHDVMTVGDVLVVNPNKTAFSIINGVQHRVPLYLLHDGQEMQKYGHYLPHSVNDKMDVLMFEGRTGITGNELSLDTPCRLDFMSIADIRITKEDGTYDDYLFNMKNYLNSIEYPEYTIRDVCYLDARMNRALFVSKVGRLVLDGYDPIREYHYTDNNFLILFYPNKSVKINSRVRCTHLPMITWGEMRDTTSFKEGICAGNTSGHQGIWIKVLKSRCQTVEDFEELMKYWDHVTENELQARRNQEYQEQLRIMRQWRYNDVFAIKHDVINTPFMIAYEEAAWKYTHLTLESYDINLYFNKCWIQVQPYRPNNPEIIVELQDVIGLVPKNGRIKLLEEQERILASSGGYNRTMVTDNYVYRDLRYYNTFGIGPPITMIDELIAITNDTTLRDIIASNLNTSSDYIIDQYTVAVVPRDGVIRPSAELNRQSYAQILSENDIWRDLSDPVGIIYDMANEPTFIDSSIVAIVPHSGEIIPINDMMERYTDNYVRLTAENDVWRDLLEPLGIFGSTQTNIMHIDSTIVAIVPNDGRIRLIDDMMERYTANYERVVAENTILRDLTLEGSLYDIKTAYFYKHLKLAS